MTAVDLLPSGPGTPAMIKSPDLARLLHVKSRTIREWSLRGILPPTIILGPQTHFYDLAAVKRALRKHAAYIAKVCRLDRDIPF